MCQHLKRTCTVVVFYSFKSFVLFFFFFFFFGDVVVAVAVAIAQTPCCFAEDGK